MMKTVTPRTHSFNRPMIPSRKVIRANVIMMYPITCRRRVYMKRAISTQTTLPHPIPCQRSVTFIFPFFFRRFVISRMIARPPKKTADQKGRNPGPGARSVPTSPRKDSIQTNTETASQKRPLNCSERFITSPRRVPLSPHYFPT